MIEHILSPQALRMTLGSSSGGQPKYYDDSYWYKLDHEGNEGHVEYLASLVLSCSNVENYVSYEECVIDGNKGCRSQNFLKENESFISLDTLYRNYTGRELQEDIISKNDVKERIDFVVNFVHDKTGLDISNYISKTLSLDMLLLNHDRHFNNLGIIVGDDYYREAPIFDNGAGLLNVRSRYPYPTLDDNLKEFYSLPFSSNAELQAFYAGFSLKIDYKRLYKLLEPIQTKESNILRHQLQRYEKLLCMEPKITQPTPIVSQDTEYDIEY